MKIIITENQKNKLVDNVLHLIDLYDLGQVVKILGSFNNLVKVIGKERLYVILRDHNFDINDITPVQSTSDITQSSFIWGSIDVGEVRKRLNEFGPMYLCKIRGGRFLFQPGFRGQDFFKYQEGSSATEEIVMNHNDMHGIKIGDIIKIFEDNL